MVKLFGELLQIVVPIPFPRMTYQEAMEQYGSDAPDTRFELKLVDLSDIASECGLRVFSEVVKKGGFGEGNSRPGRS